MKLSKFNRFLRSSAKAESGLWISAKTSSAIEGIRQPFANGRHALDVPTTQQALIDYWKKHSSGSGR